MAPLDDDLDRFKTRGDPEADEALARILPRLTKEQIDKLPKILGRWDPSQPVTDLPAPLGEYVAGADPAFSWDGVDLDRLRRAQQSFQDRHAQRARIVLACYSLPILYLHPEISLTLARTGQLLLHVRRRIEDTQSFFDAMMVPGGLRPGGPALPWIRKVRLTHAVIRRLTLHGTLHLPETVSEPAANECAAERMLSVRIAGQVEDPMPLDQLELAFVLQTFAWVIVDGMGRMGWPMSRQEQGDHIALWSCIGRLMGIDAALLPSGPGAVRQGQQFFVATRAALLARGDPLERIAGDRDDTWLWGRMLTAALITLLVQIQRERTPARLKGLLEQLPCLDEALQSLPRLLIRRLCGRPAARYLRVGRVPLLHWAVCRIALLLVDVREIAADEKPRPSGAELSGALV